MDALLPMPENPFSNPRFQRFSLPNPLIRYCALKNYKIFEKLVKTCKHFYYNNSFLINSCYIVLDIHDGLFDGDEKFIPLNIMKKSPSRFSKLWLTDTFFVWKTTSPTMTSKFLNYVYRAELHYLKLQFQEITYTEFLFLTESKTIEEISFIHVDVFDSQKKLIPLENILKEVPNVKAFT